MKICLPLVHLTTGMLTATPAELVAEAEESVEIGSTLTGLAFRATKFLLTDGQWDGCRVADQPGADRTGQHLRVSQYRSDEISHKATSGPEEFSD